MTFKWPTQRGCDDFYGDPRGRDGGSVNPSWYARRIVMVSPPFAMRMEAAKITRFAIHEKCAEATREWLETVWVNAGRDQKTIDAWGMSIFSGSFAYRTMRGGGVLSMHAYGAAIDFDAPRNALHDRTPHFAELREAVVDPFLKLGGLWGGDWNGDKDTLDERRCDGMHFQFARLG